MLKHISQEKRLAEFASKHTKQEFRLLVLFKTIKTRVEQELRKQNLDFDDDILNEVCIDKAKELLSVKQDIDSDELARLIERVSSKTKEKYAKVR